MHRRGESDMNIRHRTRHVVGTECMIHIQNGVPRRRCPLVCREDSKLIRMVRAGKS